MVLTPSSIAQEIIRRRERIRSKLLEFVYDLRNSPLTISGMYDYLEKDLGDSPSQTQLSAFMREQCEMSFPSFKRENGYYSLIPAKEQAEFRRRVFGR